MVGSPRGGAGATPGATSRIRNRHVDFLGQFLEVVGERGATSVTLQMLAERSEFSKATWYNHFGSIDEIWTDIATLNSTMQKAYFDECARAPVSADARKLLVFAVYLRHSIDNPVIWKIATVHRMQAAPTPHGEVANLLAAEGRVRQAVAALLHAGTGAHLPEQTVARRIDIVRALVSGFGNFAALGEEFRWSDMARSGDMLHAIDIQLRDLGLASGEPFDHEAIWDLAGTIVGSDDHAWRHMATQMTLSPR